MSDWNDATDPVPRRQLTDAEKRRLAALMELRRRQGFRRPNAPSAYLVNPDFDEMGAQVDLLGIPQELAEKRESIASRLSPMARHQAFPRQYARPVPREATKVEDPTLPLKAEIARLKLSLSSEMQETARLRENLADLAKPAGQRARIQPQAVKVTFCECMAAFGITIGGEPWSPRHLEDAARGPAYSRPRMVCMWLVKRLCPAMSFPKVGHIFGGRDHTTVMHAMQRAPKIIAADPTLRQVAMAVLQTYGGTLPEPAP